MTGPQVINYGFYFVEWRDLGARLPPIERVPSARVGRQYQRNCAVAR